MSEKIDINKLEPKQKIKPHFKDNSNNAFDFTGSVVGIFSKDNVVKSFDLSLQNYNAVIRIQASEIDFIERLQ